MVFKGERIPNQINLISVVTTRKLPRKGCIGYLAYILNFDRESLRLKDISVVREFLDTFLEELPRLPLTREMEVSINTFLEVPPIA